MTDIDRERAASAALGALTPDEAARLDEEVVKDRAFADEVEAYRLRWRRSRAGLRESGRRRSCSTAYLLRSTARMPRSPSRLLASSGSPLAALDGSFPRSPDSPPPPWPRSRSFSRFSTRMASTARLPAPRSRERPTLPESRAKQGCTRRSRRTGCSLSTSETSRRPGRTSITRSGCCARAPATGWKRWGHSRPRLQTSSSRSGSRLGPVQGGGHLDRAERRPRRALGREPRRRQLRGRVLGPPRDRPAEPGDGADQHRAESDRDEEVGDVPGRAVAKGDEVGEPPRASHQ